MNTLSQLLYILRTILLRDISLFKITLKSTRINNKILIIGKSSKNLILLLFQSVILIDNIVLIVYQPLRRTITFIIIFIRHYSIQLVVRRR